MVINLKMYDIIILRGERMKKKLLGILVIAMMVVLTGCSSNKEETTKILTCTIDQEVQAGISIDSTYKVTYKGDYVNLVETTEKIISDNSEYLEQVKTLTEQTYSQFDEVEHYNYKVEIKDGVLISTTKIDYEKMNTDDLIEVNPEIGSILDNGKLKVKDIKDIYEQLGATCK